MSAILISVQSNLITVMELNMEMKPVQILVQNHSGITITNAIQVESTMNVTEYHRYQARKKLLAFA